MANRRAQVGAVLAEGLQRGVQWPGHGLLLTCSPPVAPRGLLNPKQAPWSQASQAPATLCKPRPVSCMMPFAFGCARPAVRRACDRGTGAPGAPGAPRLPQRLPLFGAPSARAELKNVQAASRGGFSGQCVQGGDLLRMWSVGAGIPKLHAASSGAVRRAAVWNAPPRKAGGVPDGCCARAVSCSCCRLDAGADRGGRRELCGQHEVERQATSRAPGQHRQGR